MPEDVNPVDPSATVVPPDPETQETGSASGDVTPVQGSERPVENLAAEVHRKLAKLQSQYDTLTQYVAMQAQARPTAPVKGEPTDDELWSLAQQGDRSAFDLYMRRIADQRSGVQEQRYAQQRMIENQMGVLMARYPVLNDAAHPLTQQANATYQALLARGYSQGQATLLEAVKTAIADRPDLVAELHLKTQPTSLRRDRAQAGVTGVTVRDEPTGGARPKPVTPAEATLAKRMGIKDPAKAKERFYQRQNDGQSSLGAVASYVKEE